MQIAKLLWPEVDRIFGLELDKDVLSETEATKMHNRPHSYPLVQAAATHA